MLRLVTVTPISVSTVNRAMGNSAISFDDQRHGLRLSGTKIKYLAQFELRGGNLPLFLKTSTKS